MDMFNGYKILQDINRHDQAIDDSLLNIKSQADLKQKQQEWKTLWLELLGGLPEKKTPLCAETVRTDFMDGYRIEHILFQSQPGVYITAYLYLPDAPGFKPPYPTVLSLNGHSDTGKRAGKYRLMPIMLAKEGFAVFTPDPISQGERIQRGAEYPFPECATEHMSLGARSWLLGWNFARFRIWDAIRSIDYLETRNELELSRLSVIGCSGGGTMSTFMQALDERIKISCPSSYVSSMRAVIGERGVHDAEQFFFGQLPRGLNHAVMLAMGLPRTALALFVREKDYFPPSGTHTTAEVFRKLKENTGMDSAFDMYECEGPHGWAFSQLNAIISWLKCYQKEETAEYYSPEKGFDAETLHAIPDCVLQVDDPSLPTQKNGGNVTKTGFVRDLPGFQSLYTVLANEAVRLQKTRKANRSDFREIVRRCAVIHPLDQLPPEPEEFVHDFHWWYLKGAEGIEVELYAAILAVEGRTLIGERAESFLRQAVIEWKQNGEKPVSLKAEGVWCIAAAHAYAAEPHLFSSVEFIDPPASWTEMLCDRNPVYDSFAVTVWGALKEYDWTDLVPHEILHVGQK